MRTYVDVFHTFLAFNLGYALCVAFVTAHANIVVHTDYIFIVDPDGDGFEVIDALKSPRTEDLGDGLPRLRVSPSDHVALAVLLRLPEFKA